MSEKIRKYFFGILLFAVFCFSVNAQAASIVDLRSFPNWNKIRVEWKGEYVLDETQSAIVIRKKGSCPKDFTDGEEVYRGNGNFFEDEKIIEDTVYCYGVGIAQLSGGVSAFKASEPVKSLRFRDYRDQLVGKLDEKINRFILAEALVLIFVLWFYRKRRKKALSKGKFRIVR